MRVSLVKKIFLTGTIAIFGVVGVSAQQKSTAKTSYHMHNNQHRDLLAGQRNIHREISIMDSIAFSRRITAEDRENPALELYGGIWNDQWVNPYTRSGVMVPDSFRIDVADYCIPHEGRVTSNYGFRGRRMHRGIDIGLNVGDTIRAAFSGKIRLINFERGGYGNYVVMRHGNGLETIYGHLSKFLVNADDIVKVGDPIALGGNTGRSTGPHLHFETRFIGVDINPAAIFDFANKVPHTDSFVFRSNGRYNTGFSVDYAKKEEMQKRVGEARQSGRNGTNISSHRVKSGDNLWTLSTKYKISVNQLCKINRISKNQKLKLGQVIRLQ